jgi:hypothetical protein
MVVLCVLRIATSTRTLNARQLSVWHSTPDACTTCCDPTRRCWCNCDTQHTLSSMTDPFYLVREEIQDSVRFHCSTSCTRHRAHSNHSQLGARHSDGLGAMNSTGARVLRWMAATGQREG